MNNSYDKVLEFWNNRAGLGTWAGTRDVLAKHIEMDALAKFIADGQRIVDIGCGNGITAMELARRFAVRITGVDFCHWHKTAFGHFATLSGPNSTLESCHPVT